MKIIINTLKISGMALMTIIFIKNVFNLMKTDKTFKNNRRMYIQIVAQAVVVGALAASFFWDF